MNIACTADGTSRMVVPVTSSSPNRTAMINSGVAIHGVSPSESGPPIAKPTKPATRCRSAGSCGAPDHRCQRPSTGSAIIAVPRTSRGRASGWGSVRISSTANATSRIGEQHHGRADDGTDDRVDPAPTGSGGVEPGAGGEHDRDGEQASAMPSRRCPGSRSRARPTDRAVDPAPLASISQLARAPLPIAEPAAATGEACVEARVCAAARRGALCALGALSC